MTASLITDIYWKLLVNLSLDGKFSGKDLFGKYKHRKFSDRFLETHLPSFKNPITENFILVKCLQ